MTCPGYVTNRYVRVGHVLRLIILTKVHRTDLLATPAKSFEDDFDTSKCRLGSMGFSGLISASVFVDVTGETKLPSHIANENHITPHELPWRRKDTSPAR